jgi:hypothetical protein
MSNLFAVALWATLGAAGAAKLPPELQKEIPEAIIAVDKALGLESWREKPCVDRGTQYGPAKDVSVEDTRRCAESAVKAGFPSLGKSYVIAVLMARVGPMTVIALGMGDEDGWGAYSCDPGRKCPPLRIDQDNKWSKRLAERRARACGDKETVWLPAGRRACPAGEKP